MEVKIGVQHAPRELVVETDLSADEVIELLGEAVFRLDDAKGRVVVVPSAKIAYIELGPGESRRIGFGA